MTNEALIQLAIVQAERALILDEVPIGCVIYHRPSARIIAEAHNRRMIDRDPTAHAEILAIRHAAAVLGDWRLTDTILAVTLEPCPMCAGAIVNARIPQIVWGCPDPKAGAVATLYQICTDPRLNHRVQSTGGILAPRCASLLTDFFRRQRAARLAQRPQ